MFAQLYRQRRRLMLVALVICAPLWVAVFWNGIDYPLPYSVTDYFENKYFYWLSFAVFALFVSVINVVFLFVPALFILFAARWRGIVEAGFLGVCAGFLISVFLTAADRFVDISRFSGLLWWVLLFCVFYFRLYDRVLPRLRFVAQETYNSAKPIEQLWAELVVDPAFIDQHWDKKLIDLTHAPDDPDKSIARYRFAKFEVRQQMQIIKHDAPHHFAYTYTNVDAPKQPVIGGTYSLSIQDHGHTRHITLAMTTNKLPFSVWMHMWFGDGLGDQVDHLKAQETGKRDYSTTGAVMRQAIRRHQTGAISPNARPA